MSIARQTLLDMRLAGRVPVDHLVAARISLPPGKETGRHYHPCLVLGVVVEGLIRFRLDRHAPITLKPGDVFSEPPRAIVSQFDNVSDTEEATFLAWYLLPPGETRLIEMAPLDGK